MMEYRGTHWREEMLSQLQIIDHPLIQHKLSLMRDEGTSSGDFRKLLREISYLMAFEITRDFPISHQEINTPLVRMKAPFIEGKKLAIIAILRAGLGFLDGMLELIPSARVGHIGLFRDPQSLEAVEYYFKVPNALEERDCIVVDPMLATGHSACAALDRLKPLRPRTLKFMSLVSAPEGVEELQKNHPDVPIYTAALDEALNDHKYIIPGLGDAGDRLFGTK